MISSFPFRSFLTILVLKTLLLDYGSAVANVLPVQQETVADTPTNARTVSGDYISWREHRIDDQDVNSGVAIRGGDGIAIGDIDGMVLRIWLRRMIQTTFAWRSRMALLRIGHPEPSLRAMAGAVEDVALVDLNHDGYLDVVAACEDAHSCTAKPG